MPLIRPYLSQAFVDALSRQSGAHMIFSRIGVVGADTDWITVPENITDFSLTAQSPSGDSANMNAFRFMQTEELYMNASNHHLIEKGFAISPNADFRVCEIDHNTDFLDGGFDDFACDLIALHSPRFDPNDDEPFGTATQQSPYAKDPKNWISTFKGSGAKAIVNMWNAFDWKNGAAISQFIDYTRNYKRVYYSKDNFLNLEIDHISEDAVLDGKGGSIHIRNDIAAEFSL